MSLSSLHLIPLSNLKGVGPKLQTKLEKLGLMNVQDVLLHLPLRYEDRSRIYPIAALQQGTTATMVAEVIKAEITYGRKRMLKVRVKDTSGVLTAVFFQFSAAQLKQFEQGTRLQLFGEVKRGLQGPDMIHPEYKIIEGQVPILAEQSLTPVYPATEGVQQATLRKLSEQALTYLNEQALPELLPESLQPGGISLAAALRVLHRPPLDVSLSQLAEGTHPAQVRLAAEELLAHQLSLLKLRALKQAHQARALAVNPVLQQQFLQQLPFAPTAAQQRVVGEIQADLALSQPMMRLVQGDVGSGKTLVAALSALTAIGQGFQVALMAPTEILAEQHALTFRQWFEPLGIAVGWLAGKQKAKERQQNLAAIAAGEVQLVVGTHALFQSEVTYANLVLVIIDEQHRFGVHQRLELRQKGIDQGFQPHQLIMTATPIPRTLAMTAYADLATSIIDELPPGRTPVTTVAIPDTRREQVIQRVEHVCTEQGRQAYWVCTLIEESEALQCQAAEDTATQLAAALPQLRIGLVHGRLKSAEKEAVMSAFKAHELDLLVATTVIEVGVDVPNASLMIIENPERLGLAQLHQLRGRVGRGAAASHCVLLYHAPLSKTATQRLGVLRDSTDGFVIAQRDLELRGPGELLGQRQTGLTEMKVADLMKHSYLLDQVQHLASQIWHHYPHTADALIQRWLPRRDHYAQA
ncbi:MULTISPECIES: ATP-dependent DNA helicase RecG [Idiomarina]|uniref:ATP-dependent DNA helicase RecG n=1 Tax=Idiomarina TaxID=135575 RepID=UPI00129CA898|nr:MULTISPECIES: ATP-dependent DNA helicase RecG [Idiomarina]MRJ42638.1 ATP-dependent DNA helicase RecG [Idiomarina sp. FeN1]NCU57942.1 ATP-dependent DNA helicase RecG [Idiomarina sp. FenA--70]NCU60494.1 ATP-dependent DNA helicase RecG [Idiomarina sp. FenBw--71]UUN13584.1 ATP-dependent DNA helicase RecG [Idiomarina loihiensis]